MRGGDERIGKLRGQVRLLVVSRSNDPATGQKLNQWSPAGDWIPASIKATQTEDVRSTKLAQVTKYDVLISTVQISKTKPPTAC